MRTLIFFGGGSGGGVFCNLLFFLYDDQFQRKQRDSKTENSQHIDPLCFQTEILHAFLICPCVLHATLVTRFLNFISTGEDCKLLNRELYVIFSSLL